jgi:MSHA biogenesis protein MshP
MKTFIYPCRQSGVSIVTAIFLLVVLSMLGTAIVTVSTSQHQGSALDLLGSRAYEAARSGVEYGLYRSRSGDCPPVRTFGFAASTLAPFIVTVQCVSNPTAGMAGKLDQISITATACNQPSGGVCPNAAPASADYVQRVVTVKY